MGTTPIILASSSPRRRMLLDQERLDYKVVPSHYEEDMTLDLPGEKLVEVLSHGKAREVVDRIRDGTLCLPLESLVIGSDTIVEYEGRRLGKPHTPERARAMLRMLSGKTHDVRTGISIIYARTLEEYLSNSIARVTLKSLTDEEIEAYIATGEPLDKAGAYAMQERAGIFIENVNGCPSTVIGLPLPKLYAGLSRFGVPIFGENHKNGK